MGFLLYFCGFNAFLWRLSNKNKHNNSMNDEKTTIGGSQEEMTLPDNAFRPLKEGEKYVPVLRPDKNYPEVTPYSVSLGLIMAVIFSAAAPYLGLKVGQVF